MRLFPFLLVLGIGLSGLRLHAEPDPLATLRSGHPRLLLSNEELAANIESAKTDPMRAALHTRIVAIATAQLNEPPIERVLIGPRLLGKSRTAISRVLTGAMAYRLTGDERFAARAKLEMLTAAAFTDWNPSHFLDVAEMTTALALGYDWLFDYLTPEERSVIRTALIDKGLSFARVAYHGGRAADKRLWFAGSDHNWNQVCNGGLLLGALAIADEEPELARLVLAGVRRSLPLAMEAYKPDGAYPEGPGYWEYGTSYNVLLLAALESALGNDFGLGDAEAFSRTALYRLYIQSPSGLAFNHADGGTGLGASSTLTWLSQRFAHPAALAHSRALLTELVGRKNLPQEPDRFFALHAVWFPAHAESGTTEAPPLDRQFSGTAQLAVFRSAWSDPQALFLGFKAGSNRVNHAHLDLGSFVLDADGVRWAHDLGPDDYNLPEYFGAKRWTYFRLNNYSHNTLTPGSTLQKPTAVAPLISFHSAPENSFAIADLSAAYPDIAKKILRGAALLDRSRVVIQDEISGLAADTPLHWRLITQADVTTHSPHQITLRQNGKKLRIEIIEPANATFSTRPATPPTPEEKPNTGFTVLEAAIPARDQSHDVRVIVLLTPVGEHWPETLPLLAIQPLAEWSSRR